jgi:hypothetical protein
MPHSEGTQYFVGPDSIFQAGQQSDMLLVLQFEQSGADFCVAYKHAEQIFYPITLSALGSFHSVEQSLPCRRR